MRLTTLLALVVLLAACAGGPPKRVFPPQASVQELRVLADGRWQVDVRLRNFSTVPMRFSRLQAVLAIGGHEATRLELDPAVSVGPGSVEVLTHAFTPSPAARAALDEAVAAGRGVRYALTGRLASSEPVTDHPIEWQSALTPVPGLGGVLR